MIGAARRDAIENVVSRVELRAAVASLSQMLPPPDADPDGEWRARLVERLPAVRGFVPLLCRFIDFGATAEAAPVLAAVAALPELLEARASRKVPAGWLDARRVATELVPAGWRQRLVFPANRPDGTVAKAAYTFCILDAVPPTPGPPQHLRQGFGPLGRPTRPAAGRA